jgi:hypothetical protein
MDEQRHRGGQPGNDNATKNKPFLEAVTRAITQDDGKRLRSCAEKLLDKAALGEPWAVTLLADRLDGKAHQSIDATVDGNLTVNILRFAEPVEK